LSCVQGLELGGRCRPPNPRTAWPAQGSGTRGAEALALVKAQPGITIPELAEKMGIKQNYLYRVLPGLAADGLVVKDGRGWKPKDTA
jgi:predicted ArsR family transcriptional regulator